MICFKARSDYETPRACVHDMGPGIIKAMAEVFPDTRVLICHFHFLRDIGKDFLDPALTGNSESAFAATL